MTPLPTTVSVKRMPGAQTSAVASALDTSCVRLRWSKEESLLVTPTFETSTTAAESGAGEGEGGRHGRTEKKIAIHCYYPQPSG